MNKTMKYRSTRISFIQNYILILLLVVFLFLLLHFTHLQSPIWIITFYSIILIILALLIEPEFTRVYRYYVIEENDVSVVEGLFAKKRMSIPYEKVTDTSVSMTFLSRVLNFGNIVVTGMRNNILMKGIKDPYEVYKNLQAKIFPLKKAAKRK